MKYLLESFVQNIITSSVVEPFHFGSAPAPASQDGGSGSSSSSNSSSSSSSSPVIYNLLLKKKFLQISLNNLPGFVLFKEKYECFALLFQYCI